MQALCGARYLPQIGMPEAVCDRVDGHTGMHTGVSDVERLQWSYADKRLDDPADVEPPPAPLESFDVLRSFFPENGAIVGVRGEDVEIDEATWLQVLVIDDRIEAVQVAIGHQDSHEIVVIPWSRIFVVTERVFNE